MMIRGLRALLIAALCWGVQAEPPPAPPALLQHALMAQCEAQACQGPTCELLTACCVENVTCSEACSCTQTATLSEDPGACAPPGGPLAAPALHCHEDDLISVSWEASTAALGTDNVYLLEVRARGGQWTPANVTRRRIGYVRDLQPGAEYQFRVTSFGPRGRRCVSAASGWLSTLSNETGVPETPPSLELVSMQYKNKAGQARIAWTAGSDPPCLYTVLWFSREEDHYGERELRVYESPRETTLSNLRLADNFTVFVKSHSPRWVRESADQTYIQNGLHTKSCLEAYNQNLTLCPPDVVENVSVSGRQVGSPALSEGLRGRNVVADVSVSWSRPVAQPRSYHVVIRDAHVLIHEEFLVARANVTVPGNTTNVDIKGVSVFPTFFVEVWAESPGGVGPTITLFSEVELTAANVTTTTTVEPHPSWQDAWVLSTAFSALLVFVLGVGYFLRQRRAKARTNKHPFTLFDELHRRPKVPDHGSVETGLTGLTGSDIVGSGGGPELLLEGCLIPRASLLLLDTLGAGCFGTVCKAILTCADGKLEEVAVKKLRDNATPEEVRQFSLEIALMRSVGQHKNIVSMVGCCLEGETLLVVEYCALGDLQRYLREVAKEMSSMSESELEYAALSHSDTDSDTSDYESHAEARDRDNVVGACNAVSNATYDLNEEPETARSRSKLLYPKDLLAIARQVAIGMEFLASTRVVHRDLAARNILVCEDRTIKISDFGLSRDIYEQNIYHQSGFDKVPIKWMAMESLMHREYTTQSDVWSFGVLLWEIVTFGGSPYPSVPNNGLFLLLQQGYRMERPANCSQELYEVMRKCWREKPSERPTFTEIKKNLDILLESTAGSAGAHYLPLFS